jgi:calcium-dependent protein kinase
VILYIMLCGHPPFVGKTETETLSKISRGVFNFSGKEWSGVSKEAKAFIQRLLSKDLSKRPTSQEAWSDPWVQSRVKKEWEDHIIERTTLESLANFHTSSKFQQSTLSFIASHLTKSDEIKELENAFMILDSNGDGRLSIHELRNGFSNISLSTVVDINEIIKKCDLDINGMINYSEFITATMDWGKVLTQERLDIVFKVVDSDMSGTIGLEDIKKFLGSNEKEEVYEKILKDADDNGDGVIDYEEFKKIMMEIVKLS